MTHANLYAELRKLLSIPEDLPVQAMTLDIDGKTGEARLTLKLYVAYRKSDEITTKRFKIVDTA